ncbi:hypothetical protein Dimus_033298, partial [Dionaea muscipula]
AGIANAQGQLVGSTCFSCDPCVAVACAQEEEHHLYDFSGYSDRLAGARAHLDASPGGSAVLLSS